MAITDVIAQFIADALASGGGTLELQRNELASSFHCVPSQINYVISTRFTPERGYIVESRRGGGGYIKIRQVVVTKSDFLLHVINSIGQSINAQTAEVFIKNLYENDMISQREAYIMLAAVADRSIVAENRDAARAAVLKNMLLSIIEVKK